MRSFKKQITERSLRYSLGSSIVSVSVVYSPEMSISSIPSKIMEITPFYHMLIITQFIRRINSSKKFFAAVPVPIALLPSVAWPVHL